MQHGAQYLWGEVVLHVSLLIVAHGLLNEFHKVGKGEELACLIHQSAEHAQMTKKALRGEEHNGSYSMKQHVVPNPKKTIRGQL